MNSNALQNRSVTQAASELITRGTILNSHYQVIRRIASGSMGTVYLCRHRVLSSRIMAVKILSPEISRDKSAVRRFYSEVASGYEVAHPNVVRTFDFFQEKSRYGFSMEYVDGGDLFSLLEKHKILSPRLTAAICLQICDGLSAIHKAGIVHRDIKPENILLTKNGKVKITDFGIAHLQNSERKTGRGNLLGAVDYLSPEYVKDGSFDNRSDIYAIGMLGYRMLAGFTAFEKMQLVQGLKARISQKPERIQRYRKDCPKALDRIFMRAIERDPGKRYQCVQDLRAELKEYLLKTSVKKTRMSIGSLIQKLFFVSGSTFCTVVLACILAMQTSSTSVGASVFSKLKTTESRINQSTELPPSSNSSFVHTVKFPGETLSIIAKWYTGDVSSWQKIASANPKLDPSRIEIGDSVKIPRRLLKKQSALKPVFVEKLSKPHLFRKNSSE